MPRRSISRISTRLCFPYIRFNHLCHKLNIWSIFIYSLTPITIKVGWGGGLLIVYVQHLINKFKRTSIEDNLPKAYSWFLPGTSAEYRKTQGTPKGICDKWRAILDKRRKRHTTTHVIRRRRQMPQGGGDTCFLGFPICIMVLLCIYIYIYIISPERACYWMYMPFILHQVFF